MIALIFAAALAGYVAPDGRTADQLIMAHVLPDLAGHKLTEAEAVEHQE
jgi:hypothetical protein